MDTRRQRACIWLIPIFLLFCTSSLIFSQTTPDLNDSLVQAPPDTIKTGMLIKLTQTLKNDHPEQAFEYGQHAIEMASELKEPLLLGKAYMAVAEIYILWSQYDKSLEYLLLSLDQFEQVNDKTEIALCCNNIGLVYMAAGDYMNASKYYLKARDLNTELRNYDGLVKNLTNLGTNYISQDSIEKGLSFLAVSLMIADSLNMENDKINLLNSIGLGDDRIGRYEDALHNFYQALTLLNDHPDSYFRAVTLSNIASSYTKVNNYAAALKYALEAYSISREYNFNQITAKASKILSDVYAAQNDYRTSYNYFVEYKDISDSFLQDEKAEALLKAQARYDLEKKEQEISALSTVNQQNQKSIQTKSIIIVSFGSLLAILAVLILILVKLNRKYRELNSKLALQGQELEELNAQKDKFFSFVAHNLKNPFNTIMGFAELMQRSTGKKDIEKARQYSGLIYNLSSQVQKVLSNLLEWSRLQRRTFEFRPEAVELTSLIRDVMEMNNKETARKDLHVDLLTFENIYAFADRTMITTVLQNLLSNAINFTPASGKIIIACTKNGNVAEVKIEDTGIGIAEEDISRLFQYDILRTKIGSGENRGAGLGLILCKEMIQRNGGDISVKSKLGEGTTFIFSLPLAEGISSETETESDGMDKTDFSMDELITQDLKLSSEAVSDIMFNIAPKFTEVSKVLSIENLEDFATSVTETGQKYGMQPLIRYGTTLKRLVQMHQIDQIIKLLPRFKDYLSELEIKE